MEELEHGTKKKKKKRKKVILTKTRYCILFGILFKKLHNPISIRKYVRFIYSYERDDLIRLNTIYTLCKLQPSFS